MMNGSRQNRLQRVPRVLAVACWLVAGVLTAQPPARSGAGDSAPTEAPVPTWRAQWIWLPEREDADMLLARRTFTLADQPQQATVAITAGSRYELYVNGAYVGRGPARSAPHHQSYDVLDVTAALRKGKNALAIRVHYQREDVSYYDSGRAGLLAQLDGASALIQTDASWRVSPDKSWQNESPRMARFHLEVADRVDLRRRIPAWREADCDDGAWPQARVLQREGGWPLPQKNDRPTSLIPPWTALVRRDLPLLKESVTAAGKPVHVGSLRAPDISGKSWIDAAVIPRISVAASGGAAAVIPANAPGECRFVVYDLGEVQNGRPYLEIQAPAGTVVDIMAAPYLVAGAIVSPIVTSGYVDRIVLAGGRDRWEAFYLKPTRWLAVVFRQLAGPATVFDAGLVRTEYSFEQKGYFRVPQAPGLEALWTAAAKTVRVCTTDAYTDNYRERRQYSQTSYYAGLGNYAVFGDTALQRRYLTQIAQEQLADGLMPAYAPRHGNDFMVILDGNCFWLRGLHQYLLYSGDRETIRHLLPPARQLLDLLHRFTDAAGLIDHPPQPYWLDHALLDRRGANFCLNAHYLGAVGDFAEVLTWLDEPGVEIYRGRAEMIRQSLRTPFWDPQKQLFADAVVDGVRSGQFSEQTNAMALALKIADPQQTAAIAAQLGVKDTGDFIRRASGLVMVTPAMSYFLHAGLCEAGRVDDSLALLESRFAHMLAPETNGTLWEEWWLDGTGRTGKFQKVPSGRSDAQTESAFPPALFARYILGFEPISPGVREVVLHYHPSDRLTRRQGAIPTPAGLLAVDWEIGAAEITITLQVPLATTVYLDLASLGRPPLDRISIDDHPPARDQPKAGFLTLPVGSCRVRVQR